MSHSDPGSSCSAAESDASTTAYTEFLLQCMLQRVELLRALVELAEAQQQAVSQNATDATLGILARKQSLIAELLESQAALQPYMYDDPEQRCWRSPQRRQECRDAAEEGKQLLLQIARIDQTSLESLTSRRDAIAAQLQEGKDSTLAQSAYTADRVFQEGSLDILDL